MKRLLNALLALGLLLTGLVFAASPASAHACSSAPYPPSCAAEIFTDKSVVHRGEHFKVSGKTYVGNEDVLIYIHNIFIGTGHTDATGAFDPEVVAPNSLLGAQVITGVGAEGKANNDATDIATTNITIVAGAGIEGQTASPAGGSGTGGLAFTGVEIGGMILIAIILLGGGALITMSGRRRKSSASHTS